MKYTIFGSSGFIGSELVKHFSTNSSVTVNKPERNANINSSENLGHVIYCIGLTADFRKFPIDTVKAHVTKLISTLENSNFESFVYLSSTRVYQKLSSKIVSENSDIITNPNDFSDLYNISKIMGESVCLSYNNPKIKIARLSNVIGCDFASENFLTQLIKEAKDHKSVTLETSLHSSKDYIYIEEVIDLLTNLHKGNSSIYNIASGQNIATKEILDELQKHIHFTVAANETLPKFEFPQIDITKIKNEFNYKPSSILKNLNSILNSYSYENNN